MVEVISVVLDVSTSFQLSDNDLNDVVRVMSMSLRLYRCVESAELP